MRRRLFPIVLAVAFAASLALGFTANAAHARPGATEGAQISATCDVGYGYSWISVVCHGGAYGASWRAWAKCRNGTTAYGPWKTSGRSYAICSGPWSNGGYQYNP